MLQCQFKRLDFFSSLLELPLFLSPRPPIQWPLSSVQPQPNLPRSYKARRWIDAPFRCRARAQNGCDTRLRGERGKRASSMPLPTAVTTGLDVSPSTVCLLSSDMAESPWATLVWLGDPLRGRPPPRFRTD